MSSSSSPSENSPISDSLSDTSPSSASEPGRLPSPFFLVKTLDLGDSRPDLSHSSPEPEELLEDEDFLSDGEDPDFPGRSSLGFLATFWNSESDISESESEESIIALDLTLSDSPM